MEKGSLRKKRKTLTLHDASKEENIIRVVVRRSRLSEEGKQRSPSIGSDRPKKRKGGGLVRDEGEKSLGQGRALIGPWDREERQSEDKGAKEKKKSCKKNAVCGRMGKAGGKDLPKKKKGMLRLGGKGGPNSIR